MYSPMQANEFKSDVMTRLFFGKFIQVEVIVEYLENGVLSAKDDLVRLQKMYEDGSRRCPRRRRFVFRLVSKILKVLCEH